MRREGGGGGGRRESRESGEEREGVRERVYRIVHVLPFSGHAERTVKSSFSTAKRL